MTKSLSWFLGAATAVGCMACSHVVENPVVTPTVQPVSSDSRVDMSIQWVKNQPDSVHVLAVLTNRTSKPVFTTTSSYHLVYDGITYAPHENQGLVQITSGDQMKVLLIFDLPKNSRRDGQVALKVDPIYQGAIEEPTRKKLTAMSVDLSLKDRKVQ